MGKLKVFVLAAEPWREGTWRELARIDWLRDTVAGGNMNVWCAHVYGIVPVFKRLDTYVNSTNSQGNLLEACVGASFLARHELVSKTYHLRTEPPEALRSAAERFSRFAACGVSTPPLIPGKDCPGSHRC